MEEIKQVEWEEWRLSPVTQALVHRFLPRAKQALMEQWAAGQFQGEHRDEILTRNAAALGQIELIERLMEMDMKEFNETINEESEKSHD